MLIEAPIWRAFHEARSALLDAFRNSHIYDSHVITTPSSSEPFRASMIEFISDIAEAEHELRAVQDELAATQALLFRKRVKISASLSPIGALPLELIRMILSHVCDASDPVLVMRLSHVSRMWREAIISNSSLFTCANWNLWNHKLVRLWRTRAGSKPVFLMVG